MAVNRTPPSPIYAGDFPDVAQLALTRLGECTRAEDREPPQRASDDNEASKAWLSWHDELHQRREYLTVAVDALLGHDDYEAAHLRQWGDTFTVRSAARVAWAPVARRILRDMSTARTMTLTPNGSAGG